MTEIVCLDGPRTAPLVDRLAAVYRAAFAPAPFHEADVEAGWFAQEFATELELDGFRCCVARQGEDLGGFAYGFDTPPTLPTDGWYSRLLDAVGPEAVERWVLGQFAVGWLAVLPAWQGQGLGRRLFLRLLAGTGEAACLARRAQPGLPCQGPVPLPGLARDRPWPARLA